MTGLGKDAAEKIFEESHCFIYHNTLVKQLNIAFMSAGTQNEYKSNR